MLDGIRAQPMRKSASTKKYTVPSSNTNSNKYEMYMNEDLRPLSNDGSLPNLTDFSNNQKKKQVNWGKGAMKRTE